MEARKKKILTVFIIVLFICFCGLVLFLSNQQSEFREEQDVVEIIKQEVVEFGHISHVLVGGLLKRCLNKEETRCLIFQEKSRIVLLCHLSMIVLEAILTPAISISMFNIGIIINKSHIRLENF